MERSAESLPLLDAARASLVLFALLLAGWTSEPVRDVPARAGASGSAAARGESVVPPAYTLLAFDGDGQAVDLAASHASLSRVLPASLRPAEDRLSGDRDALRWLVVGKDGALPRELSLVSTAANGLFVDTLEHVPTQAAACPPGTPSSLLCRKSPLIRATTDWLDRSHPRALELSLQAEVGGRLTVYGAGREAGSIQVGGPRHTRLGPIDRYRARLRVRVLRVAPGAGVAIGTDEAGALELSRREVASANALWGQCGIVFGSPAALDVRVVDPPPPHMFSVGCGLGLPATGGVLAVRVGKQRIVVGTQPGASPEQVARDLGAALSRAGYGVSLSPNPRETFSAHASVDVLVRGARGQYVPLEILTSPEADASLGVCLGAVNLSDGLSHFTDADAGAGTLEERTLLKALADTDPSTIDVLVVPYFVTVGRIGESFVDAGGLGVRNAIILDRAGIRAGARSFALAHELGHVLLQVAGHPDDFGADLPTSLMDADAADASAFGPRRLSIEECERAILQSGPTGSLPLLTPWPFSR